MASVTTYLNNILSAVYGKDVRQSIHDSIKAVNTQVESYASSETSRVNAEKKRVSAENSRESAESSRSEEFSNISSQANELMEELQAQISDIFSAVYPVGTLYMNTQEIDPESLFGGTWEARDASALTSFTDFSELYMWERTE